jgi:pyruvate kinase
MNVARFNFSHGDHVSHGAVLDRLRKVAKVKSRNIAVLLDTKGPEIRTGFFRDGMSKIELTKGQDLVLTSDYTFKGDQSKLACSYGSLATSVQPGQEILVGTCIIEIFRVPRNCRRMSLSFVYLKQPSRAGCEPLFFRLVTIQPTGRSCSRCCR